MGRLIGIELYNFKSYRGKAVIGLGTSKFTSIIGPNGSGKSNLMDAISFVLGVSSSQLRSQSVKDLIYRGRKSRETGDDDNDTLSDKFERDPQTAYVVATYEREDGEILKFKRNVSINGSTEYQINGKSVTRLNYTSVLQSENILIKARNFLVFQGDVEQIASQAPKDLTSMIEHISGSKEYAKEYDKLKDEMEKAHEVTNSLFSRKRTLNSESKQYKEQASEQRQFEKQLILRNDIIKKINLFKLYHNEKKHYQLQDSIKEKSTDLKRLKEEMRLKEATFKSLTADYSKSVLELKAHAKEIDNCKQKIESTKRDLIPVNTSKLSLESKIESQKRKISDLDSELDSQQLQIKSLMRQLKESQKLFNEFEEENNNKNASLNELSSSSKVPKEGRIEYEILRSDYLASSGSDLEEQLSLFLTEKEKIAASIRSLENQKSNVAGRIHELKSELNLNLKPKLDDMVNEINQVLNSKAEKVQVRDKLIEEKDSHNKQELQINTRLRDVLLKLEELSCQQRESNKQKKLRENVSILKRLLPGGSIKGIVHELVEPSQRKYECALSTLLGRNSDAIIVKSAATAYKCIEILKERRAGLATFIPLDSIESEPIDLNYLRSISEGGDTVPGVDVVEYSDKELEPAINYIIGNTLVTKDIAVARSLRWNSNLSFENKIITLQGSVIHKSGQMTGGYQQQKSSASVSWDKQEWRRLNEQKESLLNQLAKLQESKPKEMEIKMLAEEISLLDDKLPTLKNQKTSVERTIKEREDEIAFQSQQCAEFKTAIQNNELKSRDIDTNVSRVSERIKTLKDGIFENFCVKWGLENGISSYEELHDGSSARARTKERLQFVKAVSVLNNKVNFEKARYQETERRKNALQNQISDLEKDMENVINQQKTLMEKLDVFEAELDILKAEKNKIYSKSQSKSKVSKSVEADINELCLEISALAKSIIQQEETLLKVDTDRGNLLKNCKIQNIFVPLLSDGDLSTIPVVGDDSEEAMEVLYNIKVDYEMLDDKYKESNNPRVEIELEASLQSTIEILEKLTPNSKAMERFKDVEERLRSYDMDYSAARQNERKASEKFRKVKDLRYEKFMQAFNHISGCIDSTYKELTKSRMFNMGGSAYLMLEDEDTPFLSGVKYHAVPPMKRFEDMELLSGGEKTIAALALLFAIHSFHPSPFFVLDEVDAALDNSNVARIGNFIKNHASQNLQFIVISLKSNLYEKSDALVGIYREQRENCSKTVTLDLSQYQDEEQPIRSETAVAT
ncbi:SMC1 [Candida oxycetoniae]|uniref:Structural maintenance of chromosomes protein n=1 Tax=Candida oxycetoniae TaxID=497107 RepID=A0AAI9SVD5_9ASCO|nr:SMC1 [Candida oxycetoniae]KAI3403771.2 SMC1 [Candida oxycetoniae]